MVLITDDQAVSADVSVIAIEGWGGLYCWPEFLIGSSLFQANEFSVRAKKFPVFVGNREWAASC
jgi:hypothetical protein